MVNNVSHATLGLLPDTMTMFNNTPFSKQIPRPPPVAKPLKNEHIPLLTDYSQDPGPAFWSKFPSSSLPDKVSTPINVDNYRALYLQAKHKLTAPQIANIESVLHDLTHGADSMADADNLPELNLPNAPNMLEIQRAQSFTDVLATFVDRGTVIGPSDEPPFPKFRANQLFTVDQVTGHIS